jgi:hypothetical protein
MGCAALANKTPIFGYNASPRFADFAPYAIRTPRTILQMWIAVLGFQSFLPHHVS